MMKFKTIAAGALLSLSLFSLTTCGSSQAYLSGAYSTSYYGTGITYTFSEETVTTQFFVWGFQVGSYEGTYSLNDDRDQITFTFDTSQLPSGTSLPAGMTSLGGTFSFQQGDGYIVIGQVRYDLTEADPAPSGQNSTPSYTEGADPAKDNGGAAPASLQLNLPEAYSIQYNVHEEFGVSRDYTLMMTKCADGYFFDFGDTGERYLFLQLDSGKYLQYQYDANSGQYAPSLLTPEIQQQIDAGVMTLDMVSMDASVVSGYAARITSNFDLYRLFPHALQYVGDETVLGIQCQQFTASFAEPWGQQNAAVWVDPATGLCMRAEYQYQAPTSISGTRQLECSLWETDHITLPVAP